MELIKPCFKYKNSYLSYLKEVEQNGELMELGDAVLKDGESFETMLSRVDKISHKENLIGSMKPTFVFWIVVDHQVVGSMNLREELNEWSFYAIGHIGYYIRPSERGKGYATKALSYAKDFYREKGLKKILIMCTKDNIASEKVIIRNGGLFELEMNSFHEGIILKRYWIYL